MRNNTSKHQKRYLEYIRENPGCSAADVCRECKINPLSANGYIYAGLERLKARGMIRTGETRPESARNGAIGLYITQRGERV